MNISSLFPAHPTLDQPTEEELLRWSDSDVLRLSRNWYEAIANAERDPLRSGHHPDHWFVAKEQLEREDVDEVTVFGGNRSGKTTFACWLVVNALLENPGTSIMCWSQTKDTSVIVQQQRMFATLPPEFRTTNLDGVADLHFKFASGFVNNQFTLPNGSVCYFRYYTQFTLNPNLLEGMELGWAGNWGETAGYCNLGNYFDEYLIHASLWNTVAERLSTRNAKNLTTFTPINQYTPVVKDILADARTVEDYETLPDDPECIRGLRVPFRQEKKNKVILYFATRLNKYHNYERSKRNMEGKSKPWVLMKLYGVPTDLSSRKFPRFAEEVHVLPSLPQKDTRNHFNQIVPGYTRYEVCDPAGDKPWFRIWVAVDRYGTHFVYREWPDYKTYGGWAERPEEMATVSATEGWVAGPAAIDPRACGISFAGQKELLAELEGEEEIFERIVTEGEDDIATAVIPEMSDLDVHYSPAVTLNEQEAIQAAQSLFDHSASRRPRLFILQSCGNLIRALSGYDTPPGKVERNHPWKDPFDCLLAMAANDFEYIEQDAQVRTWGGY